MALKLIRHVGTITASDLADDTASGLALGKLGNGNVFRVSEFAGQDVFIKVTSIDQRTTVTSSNGLYLRANNTVTIVPEGDRSPIVGGDTGARVALDGTDSDGSDAGSRIDLEDDTFGGVAVDLSAVAQDIIPDQNSTRSLGTSSKRFKELFLAGSTIDLGGSVISSDGTGGNISLSASGVTLPSGSSIGSDTIAVSASNGKTSVDVDFFGKAGGTSTANATFKFQSVGNSYVFTDSGSFTLSDGTALEDSNPELFTF